MRGTEGGLLPALALLWLRESAAAWLECPRGPSGSRAPVQHLGHCGDSPFTWRRDKSAEESGVRCSGALLGGVPLWAAAWWAPWHPHTTGDFFKAKDASHLVAPLISQSVLDVDRLVDPIVLICLHRTCWNGGDQGVA